MSAGSTPRRDRVEPAMVAVITVAAVVLLYARLPYAARQIWAEDGRDFLGDAMRDGAIRSLGRSQAGYYLLVSRLAGVMASLVPIREAALAIWLWVAAIVAWLVATVALSSRTWLATWPARCIVALALVLLPVLGAESLANAANLQFLMLFASLVVLISTPRSRAECVNSTIVLVATGLTTPVALALAPFAALRMIRSRSRRPDALVLGWAAGLAVQLIAVAATRPDGTIRRGDSVSVIVSRLEASAFRLNLVPADLHQVHGSVVTVAFALFAAAVAGLAWRHGQRARALLLVAVPAFGVALLVVLALTSGATNRYMVFTGLCLVWGVAAGAETVGDSLRSHWRVPTSAVSAIAAGVLLLSFVARWTPSDTRRSGPTWSQSLDAARPRCEADSNGSVRVWFAPFQDGLASQWSIVVPCDDLD